jgi:DNA-binding transcriptional MerR regulator
MRKGKMFSIGEVSRIKGITKKALRFYERIGLLIPASTDPENGYRYYSTDQFAQIDIIKALRGVDASPLEIRAILNKKNMGDFMEFLDSQRSKAGLRIEALKRNLDLISGVQRTIRESRESCSHPGVFRKAIERRIVVTLPYKLMSTEDEVIAEFGKFASMIEERRLINGYQTGILYEMRDGNSVPASLFSTVIATDGSDLSRTMELPAGEYLCICITKENTAAQAGKINRHLSRNGITPALVLQVELLNDVFSRNSTAAEFEILAE